MAKTNRLANPFIMFLEIVYKDAASCYCYLF